MSARLLLATANKKKLVELQRILDLALGTDRIALIGLSDFEDYPDVPETGLTFGENALIKAREGAARTGLPTVADDSGLGKPRPFTSSASGSTVIENGPLAVACLVASPIRASAD